MSNHSGLTVERCEVECLHPEHVAPLVGAVLDSPSAEQVATIFGVLADPTRLRVVHALGLAAELCVCDLALLLGISQSALSHQLRLLRDRRVVAREKRGRIVYYRLADQDVRRALAEAIGRVKGSGQALAQAG